LILGSYQCSPPFTGSCPSTRFYCTSKAFTPTHWEGESLFQIKLSTDAWQDHFSWQSGEYTLVTRR
jgi:hypothetical protein